MIFVYIVLIVSIIVLIMMYKHIITCLNTILDMLHFIGVNNDATKKDINLINEKIRKIHSILMNKGSHDWY